MVIEETTGEERIVDVGGSSKGASNDAGAKLTVETGMYTKGGGVVVDVLDSS